MSAPEFSAKQGDSGSLIQQALTLDVATSLAGATYQFVYRDADDELVVRSAELVVGSALPSSIAATSLTLKRLLTTADVSTPGYFKCEWRIVLSDGSWLTRPLRPDDSENPNRTHQVLQIVEALYDGEAVETEDGATFIASGFIRVEDLTELESVPFSTSYDLAKVYSDANGDAREFRWDASIVTADADPNNVVPLTSPRGGGWRAL